MRVGLWLMVLLPVLAISELWAHQRAQRQAPTDVEWEAVASRIRALHRPGDLINVAPRWAEPLLRYQLGDAYFPLDLVARTDNETEKRAIVVSFMGQADHEFWRWSRVQTLQLGKFSVDVLQNPEPAARRARLLDWITPERLDVFDGELGDPRTCAFTRQARVTTGGLAGEPTLPATRFVCPNGEPHVVAVTTIDDEHFRPKRCIYAHPSSNGPLTLVFRSVPIGKKLVGFAGLPWLLSRDGAGTPIELSAYLNGERLGRHVVIDQAGFSRFEWDTRRSENLEADLQLVIATANAQNRRLCFTLESR